MDAEPSDAPSLTRGLEDTLAALDVHLGDAERRAAALLKSTRRLRRAANEGTVASLPATIAAAEEEAVRISKPFADAAAALIYDVAEAFANGA